MIDNVNALTQAAESISNFGVLAVIAAMYLLLSGAMLLACFKWFKNIINSIIDKNEHMMNQLVKETQAQNKTLMDISESLRPTDLMQIQYIINTSFEAYVHRVCRLITDIKEENNIKDKEATKNKIHLRVSNLFKQRKRDYDIFSFGGHKLSEYMDTEWVDKISDIVEKEIYHEMGENPERTYGMVKSAYEEIKGDFYSKLTRI